MSIESLALLTGTVFTGFSVLFAVYSFRRAEDRRAFAQFRLSLIQLRQAVRELDALLGEPFFNQVSLAIANELRQLFGPNPTKQEVKAYISDASHHNYIAQTIHAGLDNSPVLARGNALIDLIGRVPYEYQEQLPLVSLVLRRLSVYLTHTARGVLSPRLFNEIIGNPENFERLAKQSYDTNEVADAEAFREIALMLEAGSRTVLERHGQVVYDTAESLIDDVVGTFSRMADSELRSHSKVQRNQRRTLENIDGKYAIEDAFEYLQSIRSLFDEEAWDRIVEKKTIIMERAHGGTGQ